MEAAPFRPSYMPPPISSSPVYRKMRSRWKGDRKTRIVLAAVAVLLVIAVFITILVLTRTFPEEKGRYEEASPARIQAALEQKRAVFNEQPEITGALSLAVEDDSRALEALAPLESDPKFNDSAHFYYHLANLQVKTGKIESAVSAIKKCLALEPDYSFDPAIVEILITGLKSKDSEEAAGDLLGGRGDEKVEGCCRECGERNTYADSQHDRACGHCKTPLVVDLFDCHGEPLPPSAVPAQ